MGMQKTLILAGYQPGECIDHAEQWSAIRGAIMCELPSMTPSDVVNLLVAYSKLNYKHPGHDWLNQYVLPAIALGFVSAEQLQPAAMMGQTAVDCEGEEVAHATASDSNSSGSSRGGQAAHGRTSSTAAGNAGRPTASSSSGSRRSSSSNGISSSSASSSAGRTQPHAPLLNSEELTNVLLTLASLKHPPSDQWWLAYQASMLTLLPTMAPSNIVQIVNAAGKLKVQPSAAFIKPVLAALTKRQLHLLSPQCCQDLLVGLAAMQSVMTSKLISSKPWYAALCSVVLHHAEAGACDEQLTHVIRALGSIAEATKGHLKPAGM
eukprot:jgi/Chrzof1/9107/Cz03g36080.t1